MTSPAEYCAYSPTVITCRDGDACKHKLGAEVAKWRYTKEGKERTAFVCSPCGVAAHKI